MAGVGEVEEINIWLYFVPLCVESACVLLPSFSCVFAFLLFQVSSYTYAYALHHYICKNRCRESSPAQRSRYRELAPTKKFIPSFSSKKAGDFLPRLGTGNLRSRKSRTRFITAGRRHSHFLTPRYIVCDRKRRWRIWPCHFLSHIQELLGHIVYEKLVLFFACDIL